MIDRNDGYKADMVLWLQLVNFEGLFLWFIFSIILLLFFCFVFFIYCKLAILWDLKCWCGIKVNMKMPILGSCKL